MMASIPNTLIVSSRVQSYAFLFNMMSDLLDDLLADLLFSTLKIPPA